MPQVQEKIIERFDNDWIMQPWKTVELGPRSREISGWTYPIVSKLNEEEILVMGGITHRFETSGDIWIFNVEREELQR